MDVLRVPSTSLHRVILLERRLRLTRFCMETGASSGRTKPLFHRKSITLIDAIEHVLNVANSSLAYRKQNRKRRRGQTSRRPAKRMRANKQRRPKQRRTQKRIPPSRRATSRARATSCSWTRSAATRTTTRASACPSVATPSTTRWALSPTRTSPANTNHAAPGRSAWWVHRDSTTAPSWQWFNLLGPLAYSILLL
jgi:hypothetical protein